MRFLWYVRFSNYLVIVSGFLALLITDDYGIVSAFLFAALVFAGWKVDTDRWRMPLSSLMWNVLTLAFLAFCIIDIVYIRKLTSVGLANFMVFLLATKILTPKENKDYSLICLLSFFVLLISSIMTFNYLFALVCVLFVVAGTWSLTTLHLKGEIEAYVFDSSTEPALPQESQEARYFDLPAMNSLLGGGFFAGTLVITLMTLLLSVAVFFLLPRVQEGFFFRYGHQRLGTSVSGFSEEVELDTFGNIRLDHTPVMRVELPQVSNPALLPGRLYWKGVSYNMYDGMRWKSEHSRMKPFTASSRFQPRIWLSRPTGGTRNLLEQRIELFSSEYRVLFGSQAVHGVEGRFLLLEYDEFTQNSRVMLHPYAPRYSVFSSVKTPSAEELQADYAVYPEKIRDAYLQVPSLAERVTSLAREAAGDASNPYDVSMNVQNYLYQHYAYSLDVQRSADLLPLEDFLFVHKAGHCEYYATSMAIFLRIMGIPSRVVNGFSQGRWNEFGQFFTVRQSDAHAWVEVYFPSYGWITFDPTPPEAFSETYQQFTEQAGVLARLFRYSEHLRTRWEQYIIDYGIREQAYLVVELFHATHSARRTLSATLSRVQRSFGRYRSRISISHIGAIVALLAGAGFVGRFFWRRFPGVWSRIPFLPGRLRPARNQIQSVYLKMLDLLGRHHIIKPDGLTPGEFVDYINAHHPMYVKEVEKITSFYYAIRYGQQPFRETEKQTLADCLLKIKQRRNEG